MLLLGILGESRGVCLLLKSDRELWKRKRLDKVET
jgi:hypothetical protein